MIISHRKSQEIMLSSIFCKQIFYHIMKHKKILFGEKKKMLNLNKYNPTLDYPLLKERLFCQKECYNFNSISPEMLRERNKILTKILGKTGKSFIIEQPFMCDYGYNIEIGENFGANHNLVILDSAKVIFKDNVMIGPNCGFYTTQHPLEPSIRNTGIQWAKPITIENNVWICANVTVLGGVTIGENSVIGAGSIVTKDIPPNALAVGNPCKVIKFLEPENKIKAFES